LSTDAFYVTHHRHHGQALRQPDTRIAIFQRKEVRRTLHNNEWWFVIADVMAALTDSAGVRSYTRDLRRRDPELDKGWGRSATPL
jgi:prophage antirepressor-like protein